MMLGVKVYINSTTLIDTYVVRIKGTADLESINTYQLPDGRTFKHKYGDGAAKLAIKILKRVNK